MSEPFKIIDRYRTLMPAAPREVVDARSKSHEKLISQITEMRHVYDLCALAFQLPRGQKEQVKWFSDSVREFDPQFMIDIDKAETARVAGLALENYIGGGRGIVAMAVMTASYGGKRAAADDGKLIAVAKEVLEIAGRNRQLGRSTTAVGGKTVGLSKGEEEAITNSFGPPSVIGGLKAVVTNIDGSIKKVEKSTNDAIAVIQKDYENLSTEVDMLWWLIGGWSEFAEKPRKDFVGPERAIVAGRELGNFVKTPPGPYGAYGVLRRDIGDSFATKTSIAAAVKGLGSDVAKFKHDISPLSEALFPVTTALKFAADCSEEKPRDMSPASVANLELSQFELAVQAFRESTLCNYGGV